LAPLREKRISGPLMDRRPPQLAGRHLLRVDCGPRDDGLFEP
jgi:hypothetical protein